MLRPIDTKLIEDSMLFVKQYNNMTLAELGNLKSCISNENINNITSTVETWKNK